MDIETGTRLGPYEILSPLGAGGMGVVCRARDTRLDREVAIKLAAPGRLADPAARSRFQREMAIAARLSHPRVCTLLDAGVEDDRPYFVMELVHGQTLATRLDRSAGQGIPLHEALEIAAGLCDALAFAHRHGVVHRDVKPSNVMLTPDGVKLLDFGVAQLLAADVVPDSQAATVPQAFMGTPAYMAPEQIDGRADQRSDLFAVGAVLYEMLTARRAFPGASSSEILGGVVRCSPQPLAEIRPALPPWVIRIVERCLRKDPDERWQAAADLAEALRWARDPVMLTALPQAQRRQGITGRASVGVAMAAFAIAAAAWWVRAPGPAPRVEFYMDDVALPDGERFLPGQSSWSRDGRRVAVVTQPLAGSAVETKIWIREIGGARPWQLIDGAGPEFVTYPSWSPDGRSLAYFRDHELVRSSLASPVPVTLADAPDGRGTTWLDNETILFAPEAQGDIWQIAAKGGTPSVVLRRQPDDLGVKYPMALEGRRFLYWAQRSRLAASEIRVTSPSLSGASVTIVQSAKAGAYADGHLFYVQDNRIVAQPIDAETWTLRGDAELVPVETGLGGNLGAPFLTAGGEVAGAESVRREARELTWVNRSGQALATVGEVAPYRTMALSPDGRRLLVERAAPGIDTAAIWLLDLQSGASRRVATEVGASLPVWHPGQDRVAFRASLGPGGSGAVQEQSLDGRTRVPLVEVLASARPAGWSVHGELVWWAGDPTGKLNGIFVRQGDVDRPYRLIRMGADVRSVVLRPGGSALAFTSNESGTFEVYVDTFPHPRPAPWQISTGGGSLPRWSQDGRELFFEAGGVLSVIAMTGRDGGPDGAPRRLFPLEDADYDVHPDGRLLVERRRRPDAHYLRVFQHWSNRPASEHTDNR
ncbi:MAG: serine/threonine-protein kinase [Acidobacteria bacterium]|nr:serine/threonine-protein kinase [Acidobacteriota bacterium]